MDPTSLANKELPTVAPANGKMARTRNGDIIGPMIWDDDFGIFKWDSPEWGGMIWYYNGRYSTYSTNKNDIVEVLSCVPREVWIFHSSNGDMHMQEKTEEALRRRHDIYTSHVPGTFSRYVLADSK